MQAEDGSSTVRNGRMHICVRHVSSDGIVTAAVAIAMLSACACSRQAVVPRAIEARVEWSVALPPEVDGLRDGDWIDDSTIAVIRADGTSLARVNRDGTTQTFGRLGSGPGEYQDLFAVASVHDSTVITVDNGLRRLTRWHVGGRALGVVPLPGRVMDGPWARGAMIEFKVITGPARSELLDVALGPRSSASLSRRPLPANVCVLCNMSIGQHGAIAMAVNETSYVVSRTDSTGVALRPASRTGLPLIALTAQELDSAAAMRASSRARMTASGMSDSSIDRLLQSFTPSRVHARFVSMGIRFDDTGLLWAQRIVPPGAHGEVDVFDDRSRLLAVVRLPPGFRILRIANAQALGWRPTPLGGVEIAVLRLPRTHDMLGAAGEGSK